MLADTRTLLFLFVATLFVVDAAQGSNENQGKAFAYWANLDKCCYWTNTGGKHFDNREEVEAHCSDNPSCIGFHVIGSQWRSCPHDSEIHGGIGCTLYKKEHVLIERNDTCKGRNLRNIQSANNCKEVSRLMWPRSEIKFNETTNAEFPTGCYLYNAELNPEVKSTFFNHAYLHDNGQAVSAPICRWKKPTAVFFNVNQGSRFECSVACKGCKFFLGCRHSTCYPLCCPGDNCCEDC